MRGTRSAGDPAFCLLLRAHRVANKHPTCLDLLPAGPLTQQCLSEFQSQIHSLATTHFMFAKTLLPRMAKAPAASFVFVSGMQPWVLRLSVVRRASWCKPRS